MLKAILNFLSATSPTPLPAAEVDLALAALLVRIARADGQYDTIEMARIDRILAHRQNLDLIAAATLRKEAEDLEAEAPDTVRFTRALKDGIDHQDRISVIEALWEVALTDRDRSAEEDAVIRLVANLLGINDRDSALARQRVAAREASIEQEASIKD